MSLFELFHGSRLAEASFQSIQTPTGGGRGGAPEKLTERESRVASLAAIGRTNAEIAGELGVSSRTVEWNLTRVYHKLGLRSRTELAARVAGTPWVQRTE